MPLLPTADPGSDGGCAGWQDLPKGLFCYMRLAHTCDEQGAREAADFQDSVLGTHAELTAVDHLLDHLKNRLARHAPLGRLSLVGRHTVAAWDKLTECDPLFSISPPSIWVGACVWFPGKA